MQIFGLRFFFMVLFFYLLSPMPLVGRQQVAWNDESNPAQGFKYLYLTASDYEALEEGTVNAQEVVENGQKRYALTDIIGKVRFVSCPPIYPSIIFIYCSMG